MTQVHFKWKIFVPDLNGENEASSYGIYKFDYRDNSSSGAILGAQGLSGIRYKQEKRKSTGSLEVKSVRYTYLQKRD